MKNNQRQLLMELILKCDKENYTLLNYHVGGGVPELPDNVEVINNYGNCFKFEYNVKDVSWTNVEDKDYEDKLVSLKKLRDELK